MRWEECGYVRTAEDALRYEIWSAVQRLKDVAELLRPSDYDEITVGIFIADFEGRVPSLVNIEKAILNDVPHRAWSVLIEPHADGRPHENLLMRINRNQLSKLEKIVHEINQEEGFRACKLSRPSNLTNWSRPGKLPGLVGYSGKNALHKDKIVSFMAWLDGQEGRWIRTSSRRKSSHHYGFIPEFQQPKIPAESTPLSPPLPPVSAPPLPPSPSRPEPTAPAPPPLRMEPDEEILKIRIRTLKHMSKSEPDPETKSLLRKNLKQLEQQKREQYPARPKEILFGRIFGAAKNAERLSEDTSALHDASALSRASACGNIGFIAAYGLDAERAKPVSLSQDKRKKQITKTTGMISDWDGKTSGMIEINRELRSTAEVEHWERVPRAFAICRSIERTATIELSKVADDYKNREIIMFGLEHELVMARALKDKELASICRENIRSLKRLITKAEQLQFILSKIPTHIQYHRRLTAQAHHLSRYLSKGNWTKLSTAFTHYDFRQEDSRIESAERRRAGKDRRRIVKNIGTELRRNDVDQMTMEIEDAAAAA